MEKTWMPTTAGILNIVSGSSVLIGGVVIAGLDVAMTSLVSEEVMRALEFDVALTASVVTAVITVLAVVFIVLGIVSLIGGIYALKRRVWGMALAGAIVSIVHSPCLGIPSVIFVALSKKEFA
jgi:hypothetical protein